MPTILNTTKKTTIAQKGTIADTFITRMTGLLNKKTLPSGEALVITRCKSIHMFFMRFAIDVIFVDKNNTVVGLLQRIKPFHLSPIFFRSSYAIEVPEGVIHDTQTSIGDRIVIKED